MLSPKVTPFVGVWIETQFSQHQRTPLNVTPFVGVWIETMSISKTTYRPKVTPFVGVWIETTNIKQEGEAAHRHTLRGCVD